MPLDAIATAEALDQAFRQSCGRLDRDDPWFGTYVVDLGHREVEYRIGDTTSPDERIVDWRHPVARAYYEHSAGDAFELDTPGFAHLEGTISLRSQVTSEGRSLVAVELADGEQSTSVLSRGGTFQLRRENVPGPSSTGLPDIRALLSPEQYRLITSSRRRPVVIQGRAGSGKTTVALYRVSWLTFPEGEAHQAPVDPSQVLIVMFNRALRSYVGDQLRPLGLAQARLDTFHAWALDELKRAYKGEVEIDTHEREGAATARGLKKQIGMLRAIDEFVARQQRRIEAWLEQKLAPFSASEYLQHFREDERPVARRLITLRSRARAQRDAAAGTEAQRFEQIYRVFVRAVERTIQYKEELLRFLGDTDLLAKHLPRASTEQLETLARFQREVQNERSSERRAGPLLRFEDLALLLWLIRAKHGGYPNKLRDDEVRVYDHLVVDEAQDFGALELSVLLHSVRSRTGVTIVGDVNQKIMPEADFMGWDRLIETLGVQGARVTSLEVAHRSTAPIMRLADALVGDETSVGRPGPKPRWTRTPDETSLRETLALRVRDALQEATGRHVCVVVRHRQDVEAVAEGLRRALPRPWAEAVRVGHNKEFRFEPGVTVTNLRQIKGLEFDVVLGLEPSAAAYPDDDQGRRWLYTLVTRAKERLELLGTAELTPLLGPALEAGLLDARDESTVAEVVFDENDEDPF